MVSKALNNILVITIGFAVFVAMDYGYIRTQAWTNPHSVFNKTQWLMWLFPVCALVINWRLFRQSPIGPRIGLSVLISAAVVAIEYLLLLTLGLWVHFLMGGTE